MASPHDDASSDHDQRLKVLLKEFFEQFMRCFFPVWAAFFDFGTTTWLDKEIFLNPPKGIKRLLDLVARLRIRPEAPPIRKGCDEMLAVIHIEVESSDSVKTLRPRFLEYYMQLQREYQLPVLPIGLFLRVGLKGIGWDFYEEHFWKHRLLRFDYAYVGLPALNAETYVNGEHLLGVALSALMATPAERRVELHAEALKRIAVSGENDLRKHLLSECLEAYSPLDEAEKARLDSLLSGEGFEQVRPLMITTYERGKIEGKMEGKIEGKIEERQETALLLLEAKFETLNEEAKRRLTALSPDQLRQLLVDLVKAQSLQELHLQD